MDDPVIIKVKDAKGDVIGQIVCSESKFKDKPMLNLQWVGAGRPVNLNFGVGKWKMVMHAYEIIKAFVTKNSHTLNNEG